MERMNWFLKSMLSLNIYLLLIFLSSVAMWHLFSPIVGIFYANLLLIGFVYFGFLTFKRDLKDAFYLLLISIYPRLLLGLLEDTIHIHRSQEIRAYFYVVPRELIVVEWDESEQEQN